MQFKHVKVWFGWMEGHIQFFLHTLSIQFRRSYCMLYFSNLNSSNEEKFLSNVGPMGLYYNISKIQPYWINLESVTHQTLKPCSGRILSALPNELAICFNLISFLRFSIVTNDMWLERWHSELEDGWLKVICCLSEAQFVSPWSC